MQKAMSSAVSFSHADVSANRIAAELRRRRINCAVSSPGSTLLDACARALPDLVRASVHYYNTEEEVARFAAELSEIIR